MKSTAILPYRQNNRNIVYRHIGLGILPPPPRYYLDWIVGNITRQYFNAIVQIWEDLNYNDNPVNMLPFLESVEFTDVEKVLSTYINLCENGSMPPYVDDKKPNQKIFELVAENSGRNVELVERVLKQLYWSTRQGRIPTLAFLDPAKFKANEKARAKSSEWGKDEGDDSILHKIYIALQWTALVGGAIGGVWLGYKIYQEVKSNG